MRNRMVRIGNLNAEILIQLDRIAPVLDAVTHIGGVQKLGYDGNGNVISRTLSPPTLTLSYDAENRLSGIVSNVTPTSTFTTTFSYDGDGRRVMKTTPWSTTCYISPLMEKVVPLAGRNLLPGNVITADCQIHMDDLLKMAIAPGVSTTVAYDANGDGLVNVYDMAAAADNWRGNLPGCNNANGITIKYYRLGGKQVAIRSEGNLNYVHTDHLNSVSLLVDSSGKVVTGTVQRFMPFGQERAGQLQSLPTDRNFTGQPLDSSTNLLYYRARYYDPALGRFTQADTIVPQPGNPQSLNRYSYVNNNPLRYNDPSGHCPMCVTAALGALAGGGIAYGVQVAANISQNGLTVNALTEVNWATVGAGTVAGAVAGGTFFVGAAVLGTGLGATVAAGAISGAISGQTERATENAFSGQEITSGLDDPGDIARDAVIGGAFTGIGRTVDIAIANARFQGSFSRYVSEGELNSIKETSLLRGGRPGNTYFTADRFSDSGEAMSRLALPTRTQFRVDFEIANAPAIQGPSRVQPWMKPFRPGFRQGLSMEYWSKDPIKVRLGGYQELN
ncbi:MAG: hypothetical protein EXR62_10110 [Chloroflexi bacterium]|nr:hypothetical protein [Chloroflexota bacterium]